jgi:hypothetical protein
MVGYRAGGQVWKWTSTFESFVSRVPLVDPQGNAYTATPAGTYRFVVHGLWHKAGADAAYTRISNPFDVKPWSGVTVDGARIDSARHVSFAAGPTHEIQEQTVRRTSRPPFLANDAPVTFTIGPVDFPDTAADQKATGARFLNDVRGYSAASATEFEHYCLDCSFRPWLDATNAVVATIRITRANGRRSTERVAPSAGGGFTSKASLGAGDSARIVIEDAWGNESVTPATVSR